MVGEAHRPWYRIANPILKERQKGKAMLQLSTMFPRFGDMLC